MNANAGMDTCGRCMLSVNAPLISTNLTSTHAFTRRKRDLSKIIKRSVIKEECPCNTNEARDACGVCKVVGQEETNGKIF